MLNLPTGLVSKKSTGALSTAANILLWKSREDLSKTTKNSVVRAILSSITSPVSPVYTPIRWLVVRLQRGSVLL